MHHVRSGHHDPHPETIELSVQDRTPIVSTKPEQIRRFTGVFPARYVPGSVAVSREAGVR